MNISKFMDDTMVVFAEKIDTAITDEMLKHTIKMGIDVDDVKLKRWINMCIKLDKIEESEKMSLAVKKKIERLKVENRMLEFENTLLKDDIKKLREQFGICKEKLIKEK